MKKEKFFFKKDDLKALQVNQKSAGKLHDLVKSEENISNILGGYNDVYPNYTESTFVNNYATYINLIGK